jgi:hypothetical protein
MLSGPGEEIFRFAGVIQPVTLAAAPTRHQPDMYVGVVPYPQFSN